MSELTELESPDSPDWEGTVGGNWDSGEGIASPRLDQTTTIERTDSTVDYEDSEPPDYESLPSLYPDLRDDGTQPSAPSLPPILPDPSAWKISKLTKAPVDGQKTYLNILNNEISWTMDGCVNPFEVSQKFAEEFGSEWHCIFGTLNFSIECDEDCMFVMKQLGRYLIVYRRETKTSILDTTDTDQMNAEFNRIGLKFISEDNKRKFPNSWVYKKKKWSSETVKIDHILRERFGGTWICLEGKVGGFSYASSHERQQEMCIANENNEMFCAWLA